MKGRIGRGAWMIPAAYSVAAIVIGIVLPRLEHRFSHEFISSINSASAIPVLDFGHRLGRS